MMTVSPEKGVDRKDVPVLGVARCPCGGAPLQTVHRYTSPPPGEVGFTFSATNSYYRELKQCNICRHVVSYHGMDARALYAGEYVNSTYGHAEGMRRAFDCVMALDPSASDNVGRIQRILDFARKHFGHPATSSTVLDVGSGLCVFLAGMAKAGWVGTAVDPDMRAVEHAQNVVGVRAVHGDFLDLTGLGEFDVVTFNKVLEHVMDPMRMLNKARDNVAATGFVYVEVPDCEAAAKEGYEREEFFIDHIHIFSASSLAIMSTEAGFEVLALERLQEPSTKYTLRAFLVPTS